MGRDLECGYCGRWYAEKDHDHVCKVEDLKERIDELKEALDEALSRNTDE